MPKPYDDAMKKLVGGNPQDLVGLLPLLPLTQDGARREVVEEMISGLVSAEKTESLWIGYALASKVFKDDLKWLKRRFAMLEDILRDTPVYQEVLAEGLEKGMEKGLEKGLETQRQTLLDIVQERFPEIASLARRQADTIEDPEILRHLIVKVSIAKTSKEAEQYLLNPGSLENRH